MVRKKAYKDILCIILGLAAALLETTSEFEQTLLD